MDEAARVLLADLGLADLVDKLESLGVLALPDIDVLLQAGLAELGMTRVQIRRLQQATRHLEIRPKKRRRLPCKKNSVVEVTHALPGDDGRDWASQQHIDICRLRASGCLACGCSWLASGE